MVIVGLVNRLVPTFGHSSDLGFRFVLTRFEVWMNLIEIVERFVALLKFIYGFLLPPFMIFFAHLFTPDEVLSFHSSYDKMC